MAIGRIIGWVLLFGALFVLGFEGAKAVEDGAWTIHSAGKLWYLIDPESLNGLQAGIQRRIAPWLWDPVIQTVLTWPAVLLLGVPGALLLLLCRRRRR